jgi:hypothetical protein
MDLHGLYGFPSSPSKCTATGWSLASVPRTLVIVTVIGPPNRSSLLSWSLFAMMKADH